VKYQTALEKDPQKYGDKRKISTHGKDAEVISFPITEQRVKEYKQVISNDRNVKHVYNHKQISVYKIIYNTCIRA
jgi:hypothetical protein